MAGAASAAPAHVGLAGRGGQQGIAAQRRVVVEILVAQGDGLHALRQKFGQRVLDVARVALVAETRRQSRGQPQPLIERAQEKRAAVAAERAAGEIGHDGAATEGLKLDRCLLTVCRRPGAGGCWS